MGKDVKENTAPSCSHAIFMSKSCINCDILATVKSGINTCIYLNELLSSKKVNCSLKDEFDYLATVYVDLEGLR